MNILTKLTSRIAMNISSLRKKVLVISAVSLFAFAKAMEERLDEGSSVIQTQQKPQYLRYDQYRLFQEFPLQKV